MKDSGPITELRIDDLAPVERVERLGQTLADVGPGGRVIYHRGVSGSGSPAVKRAAMLLAEQGECLLVQRYVTAGDDERLVDYLAIKTRGKPCRAS